MSLARHASWLLGLVPALALAAPGAESGPARAPRPLDEFSLWLGGFEARSDTTVTALARLGGSDASGSVNLEDDLGLDQHQPVSHARLDFLLGQSQGFSLEYFGYRRINSTRLSRRLEFDGQVFEAEARLRGEFNYAFSSFAHRSWFGQGATVWGVGLGAAHYRVETRLDAGVTVDGNSAGGSARTSDAAIAPLLALGWRHAFSDHLRVYADLSGVAKGGGLSGHIVDAAVGLEWFPSRRVGLAAEYGATDIRLEREGNAVDARLNLQLRGPTLFLRVR